MLIRLIYIAGSSPKWLNQACDDYCQRIRKPWRVEQHALHLSKKHSINIKQAVFEESGKLLQASVNNLRVAIDCRGSQLDSHGFAHWLDVQARQALTIAFLLGGPSGFSQTVMDQSIFHISLSAMTWPHALARLMLCEQVYRASTIIHGGSYHK